MSGALSFWRTGASMDFSDRYQCILSLYVISKENIKYYRSYSVFTNRVRCVWGLKFLEDWGECEFF